MPDTKNGPGRPKSPKALVKSRELRAACTEVEYREALRKAAAAKISLPDLVRRAVKVY